jgi:hypothetical protein
MIVRQLDSFGELDLFLLRAQLLQAGWDAFASDLTGEVAARQDRLPQHGVWSLVIDRNGRWRFNATHEIGVADSRELVRGGDTWRLSKEKHQVLTVAGTLRSQTDLPELLAQLARLALAESGQPAPGAEGKPPWHEDHATRTEISDL